MAINIYNTKQEKLQESSHNKLNESTNELSDIYKYHYVYRITDLVNRKHYIGRRSTNVLPSLELGKSYFSSSKDKDFLSNQRKNPENFSYKIIAIYNTFMPSAEFEVKLQKKFDVARSQNFYNRSIDKMNIGLSGTEFTDEHKLNLSIAKSKMVFCNGVVFMSGKIACDELEITRHRLQSIMRTYPDNFFLVNGNENLMIDYIPVDIDIHKGRNIKDRSNYSKAKSKAILLYNKLYQSRKEASEKTGLTESKIQYLIKKNVEGCKLIGKEIEKQANELFNFTSFTDTCNLMQKEIEKPRSSLFNFTDGSHSCFDDINMFLGFKMGVI